MSSVHQPVLLEHVLEHVKPKAGENVIDCTLGGGGHAKAMLEYTAPQGKLLAIEWDSETARNTQNQLKKELSAKDVKRITVVQENFAHLREVVEEQKFGPVHVILFDLGLSSDQLEKRGRGFTFQKDEPLDMRYNPEQPITAERVVNYSNRRELEHILKEYGEERFAKQIAEQIIQKRSEGTIDRTSQLVRIIEEAVPQSYLKQKIHPATRTFQALRITVNRELENLRAALQQASEVLEKDGRLAVISFHSLEDRIVKQFFQSQSFFQPITKKPVTADTREVKENPRARSAKLRVVTKV